MRAYQTCDLSLSESVLRDESKINAAERDVDEMSIDLLAMQQPMAIDLRFIIACIKSTPIWNAWATRLSTLQNG